MNTRGLVPLMNNTKRVEVRINSTEQEEAVIDALRTIHVPGVKIEHGYRVIGYAEPGKMLNYIE